MFPSWSRYTCSQEGRGGRCASEEPAGADGWTEPTKGHYSQYMYLFKSEPPCPGRCSSVGCSIVLNTNVHQDVVGSIPGRGHVEATDQCLSLPSYLKSINQSFYKSELSLPVYRPKNEHPTENMSHLSSLYHLTGALRCHCPKHSGSPAEQVTPTHLYPPSHLLM